MTAPPETPLKPGQHVIVARPGESAADFIARLIATAPSPDAALAEDLRHWLPPVAAEPVLDLKAAA
ncbi:hypothetical protein [Amycolatopsis sp. Poz14]|uniref:hypothetical protein n=1 Tax=Amycolatopsis sp. Poz14 TaxID=1447705 RepID=UPI001EE8C871|nr:hypothetical protein [Amycolatopsis sp. Poz14]MCG3757395.1 hypothetical protein [Amycolatopsis sp. Poz14]